MKYSQDHSRHGISLLEVLISIGVLSVGLLGVAALIPAGRHEIAEATRLDQAAVYGRAWMRDARIRDYCVPVTAQGQARWLDAAGRYVWRPQVFPVGVPPAPPFRGPYTYDDGTTFTYRCAVVLDPLGIVAINRAGGTDTKMPYQSPGLFLTRVAPFWTASAPGQALADALFRSTGETVLVDNPGDAPPSQKWITSGTTQVQRATSGDYSWIATLVSEPPGAPPDNVPTVAFAPPTAGRLSVAVFFKRDTSLPGAGEFIADAVAVHSSSIGDFTLTNLTSRAVPPQPVKGVKPGQWIMLAGRSSTTPPVDFFAWYRVVSAQPLSGTAQNITVAGKDWIETSFFPSVTQAFIIDNVVAVYEKNLPLELDN